MVYYMNLRTTDIVVFESIYLHCTCLLKRRSTHNFSSSHNAGPDHHPETVMSSFELIQILLFQVEKR